LAQTEALLSELRRGSREAFETIFRTYYQQVFAVAYRLLGSAQEADDVAQEAFLRLYLHPLPAGREHNLAGWLLRVATNLGYNTLRSRKRREVREGAPTADLPDRDVPAGTNLAELPAAADDTAERVRAALAQLPERQAQLLLLRQAGLSYAELAATLGVAPSSVGTLLARAERAFRQYYGESEEMNHDPNG
jgi:RNA polymerase sigma-70 factor (ECF subfamily)